MMAPHLECTLFNKKAYHYQLEKSRVYYSTFETFVGLTEFTILKDFLTSNIGDAGRILYSSDV